MQLVYLGNARYSGKDTKQHDREEKAAVMSMLLIQPLWWTIGFQYPGGNSGKGIDHVTQHYPTQGTRELRHLYTPLP